MSVSSDREALIARRFRDDTVNHQMHVFRDDGLYRHLRFQSPGTTFYYYDLVTWPGYLAIVGDAGDYVFSRVRDMFEFFEADAGGINPHYWAQKLQAPRDSRSGGARSYSHEQFAACLYEWCRSQAEDTWDDYLVYESLLRGAVERELLYDYTYSEYEAGERVRDHDVLGEYDWSETDFHDFDHQFLWCCWAIVQGISMYRKNATEVASKEHTAS